MSTQRAWRAWRWSAGGGLGAVSSCREDMHRERPVDFKSNDAHKAPDFSDIVQQVHHVSAQWRVGGTETAVVSC